MCFESERLQLFQIETSLEFSHIKDYYSGLSDTEISPLKRITSEIYNITFKSPARAIRDRSDEGNLKVGCAG